MYPNWSGQPNAPYLAGAKITGGIALAATHTARLQVGWYIIFMASVGGGGGWWSDATIASKILVPGSNPDNR